MRWISFLLLVLLLNSCKKDGPEFQVNYAYLDEYLKENFAFDQGSYWVYEDQAMNLDSIILTDRESGFTSLCPDNDCSRREYIKTTFLSVTHGFSFDHYFLLNFIRHNGGGDFGQDGQPIYILDRDEGYEFNGLVVGGSFDSLMIADVMFYNVEKMTIQADMQFQNEFDHDRDLYFVPSIGIVREVIYDTINGTVVRDLKRFNIE